MEIKKAVCHIRAQQHVGGASRAAARPEAGAEADEKSDYNQLLPVVHALSNEGDFILGSSTPVPLTL